MKILQLLSYIIFFMLTFVSFSNALESTASFVPDADINDANIKGILGGYKTSTRSSFGGTLKDQMEAERQVAPTKNSLSNFDKYDPTSTITINHDAYEEFLNKYTRRIDKTVYVNYRDMEMKDLKSLYNYTRMLSLVELEKLNLNEQKALWLNLYNSIMLLETAQRYPISNAYDVFGLNGFSGPFFYNNIINVSRVELSLNDIRDKIIRKIYKDKLMILMLSCPTSSCPQLYQEAFRGSTLSVQMKYHAAEVLQNRHMVSYNSQRPILFLSRYINHFNEFTDNNGKNFTLWSYDFVNKDVQLYLVNQQPQILTKIEPFIFLDYGI